MHAVRVGGNGAHGADLGADHALAGAGAAEALRVLGRAGRILDARGVAHEVAGAEAHDGGVHQQRHVGTRGSVQDAHAAAHLGAVGGRAGDLVGPRGNAVGGGLEDGEGDGQGGAEAAGAGARGGQEALEEGGVVGVVCC